MALDPKSYPGSNIEGDIAIMENKKGFRSGFAAIIGRPNVGKSTLMNAFVGEKVAIVSNRPQTTRNRIMGVMTSEDWQIVFLDTPGLHTPRTKLGEYMVQTAKDAMEGMDVLLVLVDATAVGPKDREVVSALSGKKVPKVLVLNKIDLVPKENLLALMASFSQSGYNAIVPISAKKEDGLEDLKNVLVGFLPEGPKYFPDDMMTDQPERLICGELIREKALLYLKEEVPHGVGVEMMAMNKLNDNFMEIHATIYCERDAHKGIIIGKHGSMLQRIGQEARMDIEKLLGMHVNLELWVKVRPDWRNRMDDLRTLGYE
jgi:GTP-binding protein Era